jgi:hypothetical protein
MKGRRATRAGLFYFIKMFPKRFEIMPKKRRKGN